MSKKFNNNDQRHGSDHGSPPSLNPQDLMGSLISPGPATPNQENFNTQWPGLQGWDATGQGMFGQGMPFPGQMQLPQPAFGPMGQQDYVPFDNDGDKEMDDEPYSPTFNFQRPTQFRGIGRVPQEQNVGQVPLALNVASFQTPMPQPQPASAGKVPKTTTKPTPTVDTQNRAAELRAKLLASRPQSAASARSTTPGKSNELPILPRSKIQAVPKETDGKPLQPTSGIFGKSTTLQQTATKNGTGRAYLKPQSRGSDRSGMSAEIDSLFAEARNAANGNKQQEPGPECDKTPATPAKPAANVPLSNVLAPSMPTYVRTSTVESERPILNADVSSDEEGEIRGDSTQPTSIEQQDEPLKSVESRQDTMTEAQEKKDRLSETKTVYGALQEGTTKPANLSSANASRPTIPKKEPGTSPTTKQQSKPKPSSPKATRDSQYLGWSGSRLAYDSYQPTRDQHREPEPDTRRRDSDHERRVLATQAQAKGSSRTSKEALEARRKAVIDDNARAAEDYKRAADTKKRQQAVRETEGQKRDERAPHAQSDSRRIAEPSNRDRDVHMADYAEPWQAPTSRRGSNQYQADIRTTTAVGAVAIDGQDLVDWLELTQYFDEDYRPKRLSRFRKMRELEAQKAELEREEQMELEERSNLARAQSAISTPTNAFSPKVLYRASIATPKMPPPPLPLPLRETTDAAPLSQATTPTFKRQYAQVDNDAQPVDKFARTDHNGTRTRGSSPTTSIRGEPLSARLPPPLDDRVSRNDGPDRRYGPRRRSPSPYHFHPDSRERRRSCSPRRNSNPHSLGLERPFNKTCFNCGQPDHQHKECPYPRRDGSDGKGGLLIQGPGGFPVSSNYKGKNPKPFKPAPGAGIPSFERGRGIGRGAYGSRVGSLDRGDEV